MPKVSVIVPVYNHYEMTKMCLEGLLRSIHPTQGEIIVIDDGSTDGTTNKLFNDFEVPFDKGNFYFSTQPNGGFASAVNLGIRLSPCQWICILNNDIMVPRSWLSRLFAHTKKYDIVGGCSNYAAKLQYVGYDESLYMQDGKPVWELLDKVADEHYQKHKGESVPVSWMAGFCLLFKKTLWEKIGGFSEDYERGEFEDIEFCLKARALGYKIGSARDTFMHHYGSVTLGKVGTKDREEVKERNRKRFHENYPDYWDMEYHQELEEK